MYRAHAVIADRVRHCRIVTEPPESFALRIPEVEASPFSAYPDPAPAIDEDTADLIAAEALAVGLVMTEVCETTAFPIEAADPLLGAYPDQSLVILGYRTDDVVADAGWIIGIVPVMGEADLLVL